MQEAEVLARYAYLQTLDKRVCAQFFGDYVPQTDHELVMMIRIVIKYELVRHLRANPTEHFNGLRSATTALGATLAALTVGERRETLALMERIVIIMQKRDRLVTLLKVD